MLYSSAFRRLAGITQVVSASEGHVFHNRLTHTLKVAQVGRRLAENLHQEVTRQGHDADQVGPHPDVVETAALAHDIGHPPFGHVAEIELQRLLADIGVSDSFEGNAQSFRIVTQTALTSDQHPGLNLTRASLAAVLKYPWLRCPGHPKGEVKWGAYDVDVDDFRFALDLSDTDLLPLAGSPQRFEAAIMDWADDITYAVHDLEDLWRAGLIPVDQFASRQAVCDDFADWVRARWIRRGSTANLNDIKVALAVFSVSFGSFEPYDGSAGQRIAIRQFTQNLIGQCIADTSVKISGGVPVLVVAPETETRVNVLKELTWRYVIERPALATQQHGQKRVVREVFEIFCAAASKNKGYDPALLPQPLRGNLVHISSGTNPALRARLVCDAICLMTEQEILGLHARLAGYEQGSITRLP
ncbi:MAG: deoxyguanosinetriphosphate triphosphohydrolase family protein [Jatrophihabitantaceae bacterium]